MELKNSETLKNLTRAFAAECQDGAKYQYMADEATQQNLSYVSTILKGLATNEMAHAKVFYEYIYQNAKEPNLNVEIKASYPMAHAPLVEMLKIKGDNEKKQAEVVYPAFAKTAVKEGFTDIAKKLESIAKIEAIHGIILKQIYDKLSTDTLFCSDKIVPWKCSNCGYQEDSKKAWKKCPLCSQNQGMIKLNLDCSREDCGCASAGFDKVKMPLNSSKSTKKASQTTKSKSKSAKK